MLKNDFPVTQAAKDGRLPIHFFLERGFDLVPSTTPQHEKNDFAIQLLEGVSPNYSLPKEEEEGEGDPKEGYSLLHFVVERGGVELVKVLLERGAKVGGEEGVVSVLELGVRYEGEEALDMVNMLLEKTEKEEVVKVGEKALRIG